MTEPDESRPGGPATPPPTDPTPAGKGDDTASSATAAPPPAAEPPAVPVPPPAAAPPPTPPAPSTPPAAAAEPPSAPAPPREPTPAPAPVPAPSTAVAPAPAPAKPVPAAMSAPVVSGPAYADDDLVDFENDFVVPRWVGLVTTAGIGLIGIAALQVLLTLVEGLSLKEGQRFAVPDDLLHRLGYPFGSLGSTTAFLVLLGVILLVLPAILGDDVTDRQYAFGGAALRTAIVLGVLIGLGALLAVRGSLHEYSAKNVPVPGYVRVQFTSFLLATLASSALAVWGAITALGVRDES